jgi:hypothetical protein
MRTTRITWVLVVLLAGGTAASAGEVRGIVNRVDTDDKQLVIEARGLGIRGTIMKFSFPADAQVLFGDKAGNLADLVPGCQVRVAWESRDGKQVVVTVHASGKPPADGPAAPGAPVPTDANTLTGVLRRIAVTEREIILAKPDGSGGKETYSTISITRETVISRDGKAIELDGLKPEESVAVRTEKRDGKLVAVTIRTGAGGEVAGAPTETPGNKIARVRMVLKLVDAILERVEDRSNEPRPAEPKP